MRIQWVNETFCPCCQGFCISAKIYGVIRRLDIAKDTKKDGIFGEFQRDGGDFVWWHSCLPNCEGNRRPLEVEINDAYSEMLDDINYVEDSDDDDTDTDTDDSADDTYTPTPKRVVYLDGKAGYITTDTSKDAARLRTVIWIEGDGMGGRRERINLMQETANGRVTYTAPAPVVADDNAADDESGGALVIEDDSIGFYAYIPAGDDEYADMVRDYLDMLDYNAANFDEPGTPVVPELDYGVDIAGNPLVPLLDNGLVLSDDEKRSAWARFKVEQSRMVAKRRRRDSLDRGQMRRRRRDLEYLADLRRRRKELIHAANVRAGRSVTPPAGAGAPVTLSVCMVCYHELSESDTCTVESCEHRRAPLTRSEVVTAALDEDEKLPPMSDDEFEAYCRTGEDEMWEYAREVEETQELFAGLLAQSNSFWESAHGRRRLAQQRRHRAIRAGARPEIIRYHLAPDIVVVGGAICQVVGVKAVNS